MILFIDLFDQNKGLYNFKKRKHNKKVILLIYDVSGWFFIWKYHSEILFEKI